MNLGYPLNSWDLINFNNIIINNNALHSHNLMPKLFIVITNITIMVIVHTPKESFFRRFFKFFFIFIIAVVLINWLSGVWGEGIGPKTLIIPVSGPISLYGNSGVLSDPGASAQEIVTQIESANENDDIVAIILEINSPGGTVVASQEIARAVRSSKKPVVAWMREIATSGGYWIAAPADKIIADPATITGSIGVTGSYLSFGGLFNEYGVKYEKLVSGPYKDTGTPYRNLTASERILMQSKIDKINDMFIAHVASNRDLTISEVRKLATGEIFLGIEAITNGLVDQMGSKKEAVTAAENLAGIKDTIVIRQEKKVGLLDRFSALANINLNIENPSTNLALRS